MARVNADRQQIVAVHKAEMARMRADHDRREEELNVKHRAKLQDARLISGAAAADRHAKEWNQRQNHDPALARTVLERTLLEVERVAKDPNVTAETALRKVAELVTPPRSRIEVTRGESGFLIRVAFRLSAVRPEESGGATHHTSAAEMRAEIEHITAKVIKDIFDYCGGRGIERLSVSCNRAVVIGREAAQRLVMRSLYRASIGASEAATIASWRGASAADAARVMNVEHDVVSGILINKSSGRRLTEDPNEPLEF